VDLDARLVALASEHAARAGVADRVRFEVRDALRTELAGASVVTLYLLPFLLERLQPRLLADLEPGARIVTHAFPLASWPHDRMETVQLPQRHEGQGDSSRIFLYVVPAQARGEWRTPDGWRLRVHQNYQRVEVEAMREGRPVVVTDARLEGRRLRFSGPAVAFDGQVSADRIRGELEEQPGLRFTSTVVDTPLAEIRIGLPVELAWIDRYGAPFPAFRPRADAGSDGRKGSR